MVTLSLDPEGTLHVGVNPSQVTKTMFRVLCLPIYRWRLLGQDWRLGRVDSVLTTNLPTAGSKPPFCCVEFRIFSQSHYGTVNNIYQEALLLN